MFSLAVCPDSGGNASSFATLRLSSASFPLFMVPPNGTLELRRLHLTAVLPSRPFPLPASSFLVPSAIRLAAGAKLRLVNVTISTPSCAELSLHQAFVCTLLAASPNASVAPAALTLHRLATPSLEAVNATLTWPPGELPSSMLRLGMWSFSGFRRDRIGASARVLELVDATVELPPEELAAWYGFDTLQAVVSFPLMLLGEALFPRALDLAGLQSAVVVEGPRGMLTLRHLAVVNAPTAGVWRRRFQRASLVVRPTGRPYVFLDSVVLLVPQAELDWLAAVWEHADEIRSWKLSESPATGADPGLVSAVRSHLDGSRLLHQASLTGGSPDAGAAQEPPQEAPSSVRALVFQTFSWCGLQGRNDRDACDPRAARALAEAAISASLSHPNIVATYTHTLQPLRDTCPEDPLALSTPSPLSSQSLIPASGGNFVGTAGGISGGAAVWKLTLIQELCDASSLRHCLQTGVLAVEPSPAVAITVPSTEAADIESAAFTPLPVLPLGVVLALARDVARGMAHLHSRGVVHADLSSANVLLQSRRPPPVHPPEQRSSADGMGGTAVAAVTDAVSAVLPPSGDGCVSGYVAKVCDFGLSGRLDPDGSATHLSGPARRSSAYSAPELVRHGRAGPAGDVYSFGVLLWELALGLPLPEALARPEGAAVRKWLAVQAALGDVEAVTALPPGLLTWPPHVPSGYPALVKTCLREQPGRRPSFGAIIKQLEKMMMRIS
ncbi:hypothetical protein GPECTOR_6g610 [Gonium pectorale]|uniref:Protein kinase domain-containing protein n=1 Tax=Gonium pectorale TaxID=33097 RepID=A0A150GVA7_GONPE|nr:hypothetical protein GPECTOR_6g610 [Gonium pectorale]|eukprot:KXZ53693.1 hypothetical protein GPECTOR_6g610 [Gonium pectorale]